MSSCSGWKITEVVSDELIDCPRIARSERFVVRSAAVAQDGGCALGRQGGVPLHQLAEPFEAVGAVGGGEGFRGCARRRQTWATGSGWYSISSPTRRRQRGRSSRAISRSPPPVRRVPTLRESTRTRTVRRERAMA